MAQSISSSPGSLRHLYIPRRRRGRRIELRRTGRAATQGGVQTNTRFKFVWLAAAGAGAALLLVYWLNSETREEEAENKPGSGRIAAPSKPASPGARPASAAGTRAPRTPESMAEAAYRACVLTNQAKREEALLALMDELTPENAPQFLEELMRGNRTPDKPGQSVWNAFWKKWGSVDGKACLDELISRGQKNRIGSDAVLAMQGWASTQPQAAAEWLKNEQPDAPIWNAAWAAFHISTQSDPLAATPGILQQADTPAKLDAVCQQLADAAQLKQGAEGLVQWFAAVPDAFRKDAVNHFMYRLISSEPQAAVNFMTQNAQAPWRDDRHAGKLIDEIAKQDPVGTAAWAARLYPSPADTPLERTPVFLATQRWAEADPATAKAWLDANAQTPWAEAARAGFTKGAPADDAADALLR